MPNLKVTKIDKQTYEVIFYNKQDAKDFEQIKIFIYEGLGHRVKKILEKEVRKTEYFYRVSAS